jgi:hypothetical protein
MVFSIYNVQYKVGDLEGVFGMFFCVFYREVEPLVESICIGIVLHEEDVAICIFSASESGS